MTHLEHQKALLEAKIEAHRRILGLEIRAARSAFDPMGIALSFLGADQRVVEVLPALVRTLTASLGRHPVDAEADPGGEPEGA